MDIQSTLSFLIQVIFMSFVTLIIFQFVIGLFVEFDKAQAVATLHTAAVTPKLRTQIATPPFQSALNTTTVATNFEPVPDPWFNTDIQLPQQTQAVVRAFPTLKLLPPASQVQPKSKAKTTKKSTTLSSKATKTPKTTAKAKSTKALRKPGRPRSSAA